MLGVVPPSTRPAQSSIRPAPAERRVRTGPAGARRAAAPPPRPRALPPRSALTADSTESTHTSMRKPSSIPGGERRRQPGPPHGCRPAPRRRRPRPRPRPASAAGPAPPLPLPASPPRGPGPRRPWVRGRAREGGGGGGGGPAGRRASLARCGAKSRPLASVAAPPPPGPRPRLARALTCAGGARGSLLSLGHVPGIVMVTPRCVRKCSPLFRRRAPLPGSLGMLRAARGGVRLLLPARGGGAGAEGRGGLAPAPGLASPPPRRLLQQAAPPAATPPAVGRWLLACSGAVAGAVVLGGVTR